MISMNNNLLITGDTLVMGVPISEYFLQQGYQVALTIQDEQSAESIQSEHIIIPWQRRSPLSARNVVLQCQSLYENIEEAVVIFSPSHENSPLHEVTSMAFEQSVDIQIKSILFILKEIVAGFQKAGTGRLSLLLYSPESEVLPPLGGMGVGCFKGLADSLFTFYQNESLIINGFESHSKEAIEFARYFFDIITNKNKSTHGKWYKHGDKNFFEAIRLARK